MDEIDFIQDMIHSWIRERNTDEIIELCGLL